MPDVFECDRCGACCRELIIEIEYVDIIREPRLREVTKPFRVPEGMQIVDDDDEPIANPDPYMAGANLACGRKHPCPMLGPDNLCTIYPTRPTVCVAHEAGGSQCQQARGMAGLPPLAPLVREATP